MASRIVDEAAPHPVKTPRIKGQATPKPERVTISAGFYEIPADGPDARMFQVNAGIGRVHTEGMANIVRSYIGRRIRELAEAECEDTHVSVYQDDLFVLDFLGQLADACDRSQWGSN